MTPDLSSATSVDPSSITVTDESAVKRAVRAAMLGNAMEWFDFGVFAYLAATLGRVFFPGASTSAQLIFTFGTFAAAFLVRPLGGMFFGPLGDRIGRKKVLATTMIMMSLSTFGMGLIPSYTVIGVFAPVLLIALRMLQGFSTGGEYGGATTFIAEYAPDKRRGYFGSFLEFGTLIGYIAAAGLVTIIQLSVTQDSLDSWAWRIPFLIGGPLGMVGLYLRLRLEETPAFQAMEATKAAAPESDGEPATARLRDTVRGQWRPMLLCIGLVLVFNVTDYMLLSYMPTYLSSTLGYDEVHSLVVIIVVMVLMMFGLTRLGSLSDRVGRKPLLLGSCAGFVVLSLPAFLLVKQGSLVAVFLGLAILGALLMVLLAVMPSTLPALFPTGVRYGALAIGFNVSVSLFGGTTPLVTESLQSYFDSDLVAPYYLMLAGVIGFVSVWLIRESANKPLPGSAPAVATEQEKHELVSAGR
ncbi:MFS transporter [Rhodococcus antarcticus]|uniref:MFS transporter n=1 Tax=Rhodococcus antarcticus TaxID=2987751 RepID=UPI003F494F97